MIAIVIGGRRSSRALAACVLHDQVATADNPLGLDDLRIVAADSDTDTSHVHVIVSRVCPEEALR